MGNKPIISICIPTRNREKYLKECLDSIINQEGFNQKDIEIVISDNASTDKTTELVKWYQKKYINIRYYKNEENIGSENNLIKSTTYAEWDYIWFFSDDDIMSYNSMKIIKENIKKNDSDFIFCNFDQFSNNPYNINIKNNFKINKNYFFNGKKWFFEFITETNDRFFVNCNNYFYWMSIKLIKKSIYERNIHLINNIDREKNCFPQNEWLFFTSKDWTISIIKDSIVLYRTDNYSKHRASYLEHLNWNRVVIQLYKNIIKYNSKYIALPFLDQFSQWVNNILQNEYKIYLMYIPLKDFNNENYLKKINKFISDINIELWINIELIHKNFYIHIMEIILFIFPLFIRKFVYWALSDIYIFMRKKYLSIIWVK